MLFVNNSMKLYMCWPRICKSAQSNVMTVSTNQTLYVWSVISQGPHNTCQKETACMQPKRAFERRMHISHCCMSPNLRV